MPLIVGSIGSPRISSAASIAASRSANFFDNSSFYGFVTTSAEALQQVRYALGMLQIPPSLGPLLSASGTLSTDFAFELPHDLLFVEISSRKLISFGEWHLNLRAVSGYFQDRPSLAQSLGRFWGADAKRLRLAFLSDDPAFATAAEDERTLLETATASVQSDDEIVVDLRRLHALVGDRLVIVTPLLDENAAEGVRLHHGDLIDLLESTGAQLGVPVLNPSLAMAEFAETQGRVAIDEDDRVWLAAFDGHLSSVLRKEFLEPALEAKPHVARAAPPLAASRRRWFSRTSRHPSNKSVTQEPASAPIGNNPDTFDAAARHGNWRDVLEMAQNDTRILDTSPRRIETTATAAWYLGHKAAALDLWRMRIAAGTLPAHRLVEAAELAFQSDQRAIARDWCEAALRQDVRVAASVMRLLLAYEEEDAVRTLLPVALDQDGGILSLISQLTPPLKSFALALAAERGAVDFAHPAGQALLRDWLGQMTLDQRENRLEAVRRGASRFDVLAEAHPARRSAQQILLRALHVQLRLSSPTAAPEETAALAQEIRAIDPTHIEAVTTLVRLKHRRGEALEAAQLFDALAEIQTPLAVQLGAINQWMAAGDLEAASRALFRARRFHGTADSLALPEHRLCGLLERELSRREQAGADADAIRQCLTALRAPTAGAPQRQEAERA